MPYKVIKKGNKYVVINSETDDVKGTYDTKASAVKQVSLLYKVNKDKKLDPMIEAMKNRLKK